MATRMAVRVLAFGPRSKMMRWLFSKLGTVVGRLVVLGLVPLGTSGCPSGLCLVKVCKGNSSNCRCSWDTCPSGSTFDTQRDTCVCNPGRVSLNSSCMTQAEADAAVEVARTTGGVLKVVRVFEIVSPENAAAMNKAVAPATQQSRPAPAK